MLIFQLKLANICKLSYRSALPLNSPRLMGIMQQ